MEKKAGSAYTDYLFQKANLRGIPLAGVFELSPVCNLSCKMCYVKTTREEVNRLGGEKNVEEWLEMARQCKEAGTLYLLLTGGEPFLYKDFRYLYEELKKMGFILSINSNATMIDDEVLEWLVQNPPNKINITMYGASNETYKRLCNSPNGYDKVTYAIRKLKEAKITVMINISLTPDNIDDYEGIREFAESVNASFRATAYMFPPVRRDKEAFGKNERFSPEEAASHSVRISLDKLGYDNFCQNTVLMEAVIEEGRQRVASGIHKDGRIIPCRAGRSTYWISWDGKMSACGLMQEPIVVYPFKDSFDNCWKNMVEKIHRIKIMKECSNCEYMDVCRPCAAMCYSETGDLNSKPEYLCRMKDVIIAESKKIAKL